MKNLSIFSAFAVLHLAAGGAIWLVRPEFANKIPAELSPIAQLNQSNSRECWALCRNSNPKCSSYAFSSAKRSCKIYYHPGLVKPLPKLKDDSEGEHQMYFRDIFCPNGWHMDENEGYCYQIDGNEKTRPEAWSFCETRLGSNLVTFKTPEQREYLYDILAAQYGHIPLFWTGYVRFKFGLFPRFIEEVEGYKKRRGDCEGNDIRLPDGSWFLTTDDLQECASMCNDGPGMRGKCVSFFVDIAESPHRCYFKHQTCETPGNYEAYGWMYDKIENRPPETFADLYYDEFNAECHSGNVTFDMNQQICERLCRKKGPSCVAYTLDTNGAYYQCCMKRKSKSTKNFGSGKYVFDLRSVDTVGQCPFGTRYRDVCLFHVAQRLNKSEVRQRCRKMGGILLQPIEKSTKLAAVEGLMSKTWHRNSSERIWIDYHKKDGEWKDVWGSTLTELAVQDRFDWHSTQNTDGDCAVIDAGMKMIKTTCEEQNGIICEIPISQAYPTQCRFTYLGREYNGELSQTASGVACKKWSEAPYSTEYFHHPEYTTEHSFCRAPKSAENNHEPFCYRSTDGERERCPTIPMCPESDWEDGVEYFRENNRYAVIKRTSQPENPYDWTLEDREATARSICSLKTQDWCPFYFDGSCYMFYDLHRTHNEAKGICIQNGWHLVAINSEKEQNFLMGIALSRSRNQESKGSIYGYHLGLSRSSTASDVGYTTWENGEPVTYKNFNQNEGRPHLHESTWACCYFNYETNGDIWYDNPCDKRAEFICEIELGK